MINCFNCHLQVLEPFHGMHKNCFFECFGDGLPSTADFYDIVLLKEMNDIKQQLAHNTSFFQGKFKKYSGKLGKKTYILKVQDKDYLDLPHVEYCCNQIAKCLKINIPPFYLIRFLNEIDTFVVHNFMDDFHSSNLIHIYHFMDEKDSYSIETIVGILTQKVGRMEPIKQFVWMCLFDALIGNHDRHGRNIALIQTPKGFDLAPFYDNPSYIGIEDDSLLLACHNPRGKISTVHSQDPTMKDYILEFKRLDYLDWVLEFYKNIKKESISKIIDSSFMTDKRKIAFKKLIEARYKEVKDVLSI